MAKRKNKASTANVTGATVGYEAELWKMADAMYDLAAQAGVKDAERFFQDRGQ